MRFRKLLDFQDLIGHSRIRYFSYGRHALAEGLKAAGIKKGDHVLLPSFICRDILSSIKSLGAVPVYYHVDEKLCLSATQEELPAAKAIIAVNYFGFPQDMRLFREYCSRNGVVLIEDNAHGLFSCDENGQLLGTRGDIGIFSLRKTIPTPDGAALVFNKAEAGYRIQPQIEFSRKQAPCSFMIKRLLVKLAPLGGIFPLKVLTAMTRRMRRLATGHEILPSLPDAECELPGIPNPCRQLPDYLAVVDTGKEIRRRRAAYLAVQEILANTSCLPVFQRLPDNAAPYGYPFYCPENGIQEIQKLLGRHGLECFRWPELPEAIRPAAPDFYRSVWLVNFLPW